MIIGVKYWAHGASAPGSWTNLDVDECEATRRVYSYDSGEALDGQEWNYKRKRYRVRIVVGPLAFNDGTYGPIAQALREADLMRVKDTRYSWLGDANTINFNVRDSEEVREEPSIITRSVEIEGTAVTVY